MKSDSLHLRHHTSLHYSRGVSLIELMVSMAIGLFLVLGATELYVNSRKSADVDDSVARLQETARYAMSVIETDLRMANFWGLAKGGAAIINKPTQINPTNPSTALVSSPGAANCGATYAIDVENFVDATNNSYNLACGAHSSAVTTADTLTIRRAATSTSALDTTATTLQLCASRTSTEIILGSACANSIYDLEVNGYYVDQQSGQSTTYPSLRRKTLIAGPSFMDVEVVAGVEDMQVELGWDPTGTGNAVEYVQPGNTVLSSGYIVAVRVWLLVRSETQDASFTDTTVYQYGDRAQTNGTTNNLNSAGAGGLAYAPNDHYRRMLVSRTVFLRNSTGT